ncbi:MAG: DUF1003 domain-containing protein [Armatimonas sp.]
MDEIQDSPCGRWAHDHPPPRNINAEFEESQTLGQRLADRIAAGVGSWPFILIQSVILIFWIVANVYFAMHPALLKAWDPYPFILLNLVLSFQAAYTGPVVMMSQNRQSDKDRLTAQRDFEVDRRAESEVAVVMQHLIHQDRQIELLREELIALRHELKRP